ncbi:MAG: hypothetical protein HY901_31120 [Deltaproteobacteria bacterium]|nr:hypothetical protein [Deltaproteobacteria bacterium]
MRLVMLIVILGLMCAAAWWIVAGRNAAVGAVSAPPPSSEVSLPSGTDPAQTMQNARKAAARIEAGSLQRAGDIDSAAEVE